MPSVRFAPISASEAKVRKPDPTIKGVTRPMHACADNQMGYLDLPANLMLLLLLSLDRLRAAEWRSFTEPGTSTAALYVTAVLPITIALCSVPFKLPQEAASIKGLQGADQVGCSRSISRASMLYWQRSRRIDRLRLD